MSEFYVVKIHSLSQKLYKELNKYEPKFDRKTHCILLHCDNDSLKGIIKRCKKMQVTYEVINPNFERGSSYRRTFFNCNKPILKHYFCAYCGKLIPEKEVTVDHIYPIAKVKNSIRKQKVLSILGIKNINDNTNLTAACKSCNSRKSTNTGTWIVRGICGKHKLFWCVIHLIRFSLLNMVVYFILENFLNNKQLFFM